MAVLIVVALAVAIWVGWATATAVSIYPTWASPCGGIPPLTAPSADTARCQQERQAEIADPPVNLTVDWIAAVGAGAVVLVAGGLIVGLRPTVRGPASR